MLKMLIKDMRQGDKSSPYVIFLDKLIPVQLAFVQAAHLWLLQLSQCKETQISEPCCITLVMLPTTPANPPGLNRSHKKNVRPFAVRIAHIAQTLKTPEKETFWLC